MTLFNYEDGWSGVELNGMEWINYYLIIDMVKWEVE